MKKSLIALAVAAALPATATADIKFSGSVTATYNNMRAIESAKSEPFDATKATLTSTINADTKGTDVKTGIQSYLKGKDAVELAAEMTLSVSEVLANGMTATGSFKVEDNSSVTAGLSGEFGSLSFGSAAIEATMDKGDLGNVYGASSDTGDAITYEGTVGDMSVGFAQQSGSTGNSQAYASMSFEGVNLGVGTSDPKGAGKSTNVMGGSYTVNGLTLNAGKASGKKAVTGASYTNTFGDLAVTATVSSDKTRSMSATYSMGDISITAQSDHAAAGKYEISENATGYVKGKTKTDATLHTGAFTGGSFAAKTTNILSATYTSDDLTATVSSDKSMSVAMGMGNADLTLSRVAAQDATNSKQTGLVAADKGFKVAVPAHTKLTYKVSF